MWQWKKLNKWEPRRIIFPKRFSYAIVNNDSGTITLTRDGNLHLILRFSKQGCGLRLVWQPFISFCGLVDNAAAFLSSSCVFLSSLVSAAVFFSFFHCLTFFCSCCCCCGRRTCPLLLRPPTIGERHSCEGGTAPPGECKYSCADTSCTLEVQPSLIRNDCT